MSTPELHNQRPLRIFYVADPRSVHTARWIRFFADRGHTVALASQQEVEHGLKVDAFYPLSERGAAPGLRLLGNVLEVRRALHDFRPDVLHAHYINESGWLGAFSGFHPFALTAWGSDVYLAMEQSRLAKVLTPRSVRRADYVTADSFDQIEVLQGMGIAPDKTEMVCWGVELDDYPAELAREWRRKQGISAERKIVLSPRQWIGNSNIDVIVDAFAQARATCPDALLILKRMVGAPDFNAQIEERVREHNLGDGAMILEEMPETELAGMYAAADIVVSVCSSDGTPVSVLEAMAARSALIVTDLPSLRQWIVEGESGLLVAPRDTAQLADRLAQLLANDELRRALSAGARRVAEEKAGRATNLAKVEATYRKLAAHSPYRSRAR